jgi:hypothetical protein
VMWGLSAPGNAAEECFMRIDETEYELLEHRGPHPLEGIMPGVRGQSGQYSVHLNPRFPSSRILIRVISYLEWCQESNSGRLQSTPRPTSSTCSLDSLLPVVRSIVEWCNISIKSSKGELEYSTPGTVLRQLMPSLCVLASAHILWAGWKTRTCIRSVVRLCDGKQ